MHPYSLDQNYFIQTVTHYYIGRLVHVYNEELVLEEASWIPDTGRFGQFVLNGEINEVEPYPPGRLIIGRGSIVQAFQWNHDLPRIQR